KTLQNATSINPVPTSTSKFTYKMPSGGLRAFRYRMVGTNPWVGSASTTVPVEIIPIALIFSNGASLDGASRVASTTASPIFQPFASEAGFTQFRSEEHTSELQSRENLVCRLLLEKKKKKKIDKNIINKLQYSYII